MFYTQVNAEGIIVLSMYTTDPGAPVPPGIRLLPDNPPKVRTDVERLVRLSPQPPMAEEIIYELVDIENRPPRRNEVLL